MFFSPWDHKGQGTVPSAYHTNVLETKCQRLREQKSLGSNLSRHETHLLVRVNRKGAGWKISCKLFCYFWRPTTYNLKLLSKPRICAKILCKLTENTRVSIKTYYNVYSETCVCANTLQ